MRQQQKNLVWEQVDHDIQRARIPMGWLVREYQDVLHFNVFDHEHTTDGYDWRVTLTFVPDPNNEWKLEIPA